MARSYSMDLRERIVKAVLEDKLSKTAVAKRFGVNRGTVRQFVVKYQAGNLEAGKAPGNARLVQGETESYLAKQVAEHPSWTLEQRCLDLHEKTGVVIRKSAMVNSLKRLGVSFKKEEL